TQYALEALTDLAARPADAIVPSHVIARERGLPERFIVKVPRPLATPAIPQSARGPNCGYRLVRPSEEVPVLGGAQGAEPGFLAVAPGHGGRLGPFLARGCCRGRPRPRGPFRGRRGG